MIASGEVVQLKSGGPKMTVAWVEEGEAYCEWFIEGKIQGSKFPVHSLIKVN